MGLAPEEAAPIHRRLFTEFCDIEMKAGGPDPQILLTARAIQQHHRSSPELAGLFVNPYSCAGGAILWRLQEKKPDPMEWIPWLTQHGKIIPIRKERRPVKGAWERFSICAASYLEWSRTEYPKVRDQPYREVYASVNKHVKYMGRYATMKLLEVLYQAEMIKYPQDTMVPRDGKFPRRTMALLMPEHTEMLKGTRQEEEVDALCERIRQGIETRIGMPVSWFQIETMLCIYRQSLKGKYPSGRHDSELGHWYKTITSVEPDVAADLCRHFPFSTLREQLYPKYLLGEYGEPPWFGIRPELEEQRKAEMDALGIT
jgi:hypothetical protein